MYNWLKEHLTVVYIIIIITIIISPFLLTLPSISFLDFKGTGQIGDTIGGITAPIIGILSSTLLYLTLKEQFKFNESQKKTLDNQQYLQYKQQFESTFFNLLQNQRDILEKLSLKVKILDRIQLYCSFEYNYHGIELFHMVRYELANIHNCLTHNAYTGEYNEEFAFSVHEDLQTEIREIHPDEQDEYLYERRLPIILSFTNSQYNITQSMYTKFQNSNSPDKLKLMYQIFNTKYYNIEHYFRHLYHILEFIKINEDSQLLFIKDNNIERTEEIKKDFRTYAQLIQAQMSTNELIVLFYYSFFSKKMQDLIIYYDLLENLKGKDLIHKSHKNYNQHIKLN